MATRQHPRRAVKRVCIRITDTAVVHTDGCLPTFGQAIYVYTSDLYSDFKGFSLIINTL